MLIYLFIFFTTFAPVVLLVIIIITSNTRGALLISNIKSVVYFHSDSLSSYLNAHAFSVNE